MGDLDMTHTSASTPDFFRCRLDQMIDLHHPLASLAQRLPWAQIGAALAPHFARKARAGTMVDEGVGRLARPWRLLARA